MSTVHLNSEQVGQKSKLWQAMWAIPGQPLGLFFEEEWFSGFQESGNHFPEMYIRIIPMF
jgi:hypothetical protein